MKSFSDDPRTTNEKQGVTQLRAALQAKTAKRQCSLTAQESGKVLNPHAHQADASSAAQDCYVPVVIPTDEAARLINRRPQTLRKWACLENGPIRPIRINGRLAWKLTDIQTLLNGKTPSDLHALCREGTSK